jgi:oxygen-independent coproporphyrinogen-3 oxidase
MGVTVNTSAKTKSARNSTAPEMQDKLPAYKWREEPVGLYLHIPFCQSKCIYCDFNSYAGLENRHAAFVDAMCADIRRGVSGFLPGEPDCAEQRISTVFFGGGTPSVLTPEHIGRILEAARARYELPPGIEITMEANPGTISLENFDGYRSAGVNRLSMGVQVLDDVMLMKLGRIHTADGAIASYRLAREAGFGDINLDFIFGLPGQDLAHLDGTLDRLLSLDPLPEHLSTYSLIVEEHTPLYVGVMRGLIHVPDDDLVADMYESTGERLRAAGYHQYEISNWTRARRCEHNLTYWHDRRYLAFGPGASGYWGDTRYTTVLGPDDYIRRVQQGETVVADSEHVGVPQEQSEVMMMGLRLNDGVNESEFVRRFGVSIQGVFGPQVDRLIAAGLLLREDGHHRLTEHGRLLGNEAFAAFV